MPHLILVGLPGAGKSTVGQGVAALLGWLFVDLDEEIERAAGMAVREIFTAHGEAHFRHLERTATAALRGRAATVIAPGGGWVMDPTNVALLRPPGRIIYLRASPETALRRLGASVAERPLLMGDPLVELHRHLAAREARYLMADAVVDTEDVDTEAVIRIVAELAEGYGGG